MRTQRLKISCSLNVTIIEERIVFILDVEATRKGALFLVPFSKTIGTVETAKLFGEERKLFLPLVKKILFDLEFLNCESIIEMI